MNSLVLILGSIVIFVIAYFTYGTWLAKAWGIDETRPTPAHTKEDGIDYVPSKPQVLLGHHFASIAGAGPITGPIQAAIFGWVPVMLWIIIGGIFFGGVHDFGSLTASMKHDGKSIGVIIEEYMGHSGKMLFSAFAWLTLLLVVAAFTNIVAASFASTPAAATTSVLFVFIAVIFGYAVYRKGVGLGIATVFGVIGLFVSIYLGMKFPLQLGLNTWIVILAIYAFIASTAPVWILLQPRDYLNSYLLYVMMAGAIIGLFVMHPVMKIDAFAGFTVKTAVGNQYLFPILFITVACGAISGFHSLVGSGTTSKQIDNEKDAKFIGYGGMLIESVLAVVAIITAGYLTAGDFSALLAEGGPVVVFAQGVGTFMTAFGMPLDTGITFVTLAVSAFALTSLDTATRLARFIFQEYFEKEDVPKSEQPIMTNMYFSTAITVFIGAFFAGNGYQVIWPIFGAANQLLAALALLALAVWMKGTNRSYSMFSIPMVFMFAATLSTLVLNIKANLATLNVIMVVLPAILFVLAVVLAYQGYQVLVQGKDLRKRPTR
ncbi:MAG: carbon starvation protein A [Tissierellia bacterium]|nr:carbon starvation protein A [Tissierellia bacterium]